MMSVLTFCLTTLIFFTGVVSGNLVDLIRQSNSNSTCLEKIFNAKLNFMTLAYMFDASAKFPVGVLDLNLFNLGEFDECYRIQDKNVYGKYCLGIPTVPSLGETSLFMAPPNPIHIQDKISSSSHTLPTSMGICVPNFCTAEELTGRIIFDETRCYSKDKEPSFSVGAILTLVLLSVFLLIVIVSTFLDIYYQMYEKGQPNRILTLFSFYTNMRQLLKTYPPTTRDGDILTCLSGIRALTMIWVVAGHEYFYSIESPFSSLREVEAFVKGKSSMFVVGATVSVDTFFMLSGLVVVYVYLKGQEKGAKLNILQFYILRYIRLTPALLIVMLVNTFLIEYITVSPLWYLAKPILSDPCKTSWWASLLYVNNYVHKYDTCVPQSWYLMVDTQLFVLTPLFLLPMTKYPKYTLYALGVALISGLVSPFVVGYIYEINASGLNSEYYMYNYYINTGTRFAPYVLGMFLGYIIHQFKKREFKVPFSLNILLWLAIVMGLLACVYIPHELIINKYDRLTHSFCLAFLRPVWSLFVAMVVFLCVTNNGGIINWFLSLPVFQIVAKLSYSIYLTHFSVIILRFLSLKYVFRFSHFNAMFNFWGDFVLSLALSLILCLTFESPIIGLTKAFLSKKPREGNGGGSSKRAPEAAENNC